MVAESLINSTLALFPLHTYVVQVTVPVPGRKAEHKGDCTTSAAMQASASSVGFTVFGAKQRPFDRFPASTTIVRRLAETGEPEGPLVLCYRQCYYAESLPIPFYFGVVDGVCYCAKERYVIVKKV